MRNVFSRRSSSKANVLERALANSRAERAPPRLPRPLYPELIEEEYATELQSVVDWMKNEIDTRIVPSLARVSASVGRERVKKDADDLGDLADEFNVIRIRYDREYTREELKRLAALTGGKTSKFNATQMNAQFGPLLEIDLFGGESWLAKEMGEFVVENVSLIKSIGDEYLGQVEKLVASNIRQGLPPSDIAAELEDRYDVSSARANLIARDQIGKFNGQLSELRQKDLGIDSYLWRTSGDARVRESHQILDGKTFAWNDPPEPGHPGQDYQCRCWADPVLDKFFDGGA